jgi:transposase
MSRTVVAPSDSRRVRNVALGVVPACCHPQEGGRSPPAPGGASFGFPQGDCLKKASFAGYALEYGEQKIPYLPTSKWCGRPRLHSPPEILNAGIVDAQSAKTTRVGGEQRGFDGGKKVSGRKRHLLVDTEGLVIEARVHSARVPDQDGIRRLLEPVRSRRRRLSYLWMDAGYRGRGKEGHQMDLSKLPTRPGFEKLPRRWVAERTFAWICHNRGMAKDYERLRASAEAFIHVAMRRLMVRRLARA